MTTPSASSENWEKILGTLSYASTLLGIVVCGIVLIAYAVVACRVESRKYLDRVSFRLLVQALVCNLALTLTPTRAGKGCEFGAFIANSGLLLATFYTAFIAVNLHGKALEKYYVAITISLALVLNVPAYAMGQLGRAESEDNSREHINILYPQPRPKLPKNNYKNCILALSDPSFLKAVRKLKCTPSPITSRILSALNLPTLTASSQHESVPVVDTGQMDVDVETIAREKGDQEIVGLDTQI
ncbi:hypothetical protein H0H92_014057 [Tricholoma furcatifolium]|nr:hypothetical protein H0H92_014057 [Tricholoma furcatifolium]